MLAAEVIIPQMFTAYAEDLGYLNTGLHHYQYFCKKCDQNFSSAWGRKTGYIRWYERGDYFHCPHCGTEHRDNTVCVKRKVEAPNKVRLRVKVYQNLVVFEVVSETLQFRDFLRIYKGKYKENFRFDIAKQTVLFNRHSTGDEVEAFEIGNPYNFDFITKSILRFFTSSSLANLEQKKELNRILKVLREAVHNKLEKHLGYKVSSMYTASGQYHGTFLVPILNMAYRVLFPDAPNLPSLYREDRGVLYRFWKDRLLLNEKDSMDSVIALTRQKTDFITSLITVNSLPNKPFIRKILGSYPFEVGLLKTAFNFCKNYDYAVRLYKGFKKLGQNDIDEDFLEFLKIMLSIYGESGIVQLVEGEKELQLKDCRRLYQQLNEDNRRAIITEGVRLKNLHDWMAREHRKQYHNNIKFDVPDHIVKRLSMQKDRLKFFLPKESLELLEAGTEMHNCVASYGDAMGNNSSWITLVADDKGKLAACLEVKGRDLIQAKVDSNKPVSINPKLNAEVITWAKEAGLEIRTDDINLKPKELILKTG